MGLDAMVSIYEIAGYEWLAARPRLYERAEVS